MVAGVLAAALLAAGAGCGPGGPATVSTRAGRPAVVVSFYALQYVVSRIGGPYVDTVDLARPGAEPHELELTPRDIADVTDADLVVYLSGFQPAVDDAVAERDREVGRGPGTLDVRPYARLVPAARHGLAGGREVFDPHFWLDPHRLAAVAHRVARRLGRIDPARRTGYRARAARLDTDLARLDADLRTGLRTCRDRRLVTSHTAFGYLADRYGLHQVGVAGLSPEDEPRATEMARAVDLIRQRHVHTVYAEARESSAIARTLARDAGARTAELDPVETVTGRSTGDDYLRVMRANLRTLLAHQDCG